MTARWLPRTRDVTAVSLGALVAADALVTQLRDHHPVTAWAAFAGAGAGAAALWWRRAHPVAVTVLGLVLCVAVHIEWTLAVGLTTLAIRRRDRVTWSLSAAAVAALTVESLAGGTHGHPDLVGSLSLAVPWVALFACTGAFLGQRRDSIAGLKERAERAEAEQEMRAEQSRLNERTRIATEMHDVLAHRISLIALHAGGLEVTEDPDAEGVRQTAGLIRETARTALEDLRGILGVLKTPDGRRAELAPQPRFADVGGLIRASAEAGIPNHAVRRPGPRRGRARAAGPGGLPRGAGVADQRAQARGRRRDPDPAGRGAGAAAGDLRREPRAAGPGRLAARVRVGLVGLRERVTVAGGTLTRDRCAAAGSGCGPGCPGRGTDRRMPPTTVRTSTHASTTRPPRSRTSRRTRGPRQGSTTRPGRLPRRRWPLRRRHPGTGSQPRFAETGDGAARGRAARERAAGDRWRRPPDQ